ncbi:hypothetical protein [Arcobacter porcinus]|uniref:Uncharacterized protein n=1 Tax=Arcobacter porcinus TaxID=1935204 RepID=A0A5C2HCU8_9BACT|nr:hypothetical protein [Arcobacter porcinus]OCL96787.1 hypothetical protein AAX27_00419 [Aliarcobacter thereius]QEP40617.1 hypothetical protein APORC_1015 [Arcobacter porcinus]
MENLNLEATINLLAFASKDKSLSHSEFRILVYITKNSTFTIKQIQKDISISSINLICKSLKKLTDLTYIIKEKTNQKNKFNISPYIYYINTKKLYLHNNYNNSIDTTLKNANELYNYFFEKIPTTRKINKADNLKAIDYLHYNLKISFFKLKEIIDYISQNEDLKLKYSRPTFLRKDIDYFLELDLDRKVS